MIDVAVSGATGRMGRTLGRLLGDAPDLRAIGGIAPDRPMEGPAAIGYPEIVEVEEAGPLLGRAHAVIDFSAPDQVARLLDRYAETLTGRALLVGTTGLTDDLERALDAQAEGTAVLVASNFSLGVNLLLGLVEQAARALPADGYDIEVVETHHRLKEDAPSGTALSLAEAAARGRGRTLEASRRDGRSGRIGPRPTGEIGLHSVRGGAVAGEHQVRLLGEREQITLSHSAASRELFAEGAMVAARWLADKPAGRYGMAQVLGLEP